MLFNVIQATEESDFEPPEARCRCPLATIPLARLRTDGVAPRCCLLIGVGDAQDRSFSERSADDLHGERQAHPIKSGADRNRRVACHVEDRGQVRPLKEMGRFVHAHFWRRPVGAKRCHGVIASEERLHLGDQLGALTLRLDVVDRPDEPAGDGAAKLAP